MKVQQLMTQDPATCRSDDSLNVAARIFWERDCGCVPVIDAHDSHIVGMLTDRDVCMAAYIEGQPLRDIQASVAMSKMVHSCKPEDSIQQAEEIMRKHKLRRLPVVGATGSLVGILSINDLAIEAARERSRGAVEVLDSEVGETLSALSEHRGLREPMVRGV
jgi:CBS domain-containing protein